MGLGVDPGLVIGLSLGLSLDLGLGLGLGSGLGLGLGLGFGSGLCLGLGLRLGLSLCLGLGLGIRLCLRIGLNLGVNKMTIFDKTFCASSNGINKLRISRFKCLFNELNYAIQDSSRDEDEFMSLLLEVIAKTTGNCLYSIGRPHLAYEERLYFINRAIERLQEMKINWVEEYNESK